MASKQNKASFVHLHVHSAFLSQVFYKDNYFKELIREAVEGGMDTLALTDHGTLLGAYFFREAARAKRIKPVHGLEIDIYPKDVTNNLSTNYLPPYHHVLLLAINATGFQNLVQLTDRYCWPESSPYPYINREMLSQFSEGLICTSACIYGEIPSALLRGDYDDALCIAGEYKDIFGTERFFIEVKNIRLEEQQRINPVLVQLAAHLGIRLVGTDNVYFTNCQENRCHNIYSPFSMGGRSDLPARKYASEKYLKSAVKMRAALRHFPGAADNTLAIAEMCNFDLDPYCVLLPYL